MDDQKKEKEETFLDGPMLNYESENCIASGSKLQYSKYDGEESSSTINQLNLDEELDFSKFKVGTNKRINIFEAVLEQEAEYESDISEEEEVGDQRLRPKSQDGDRPKSSCRGI